MGHLHSAGLAEIAPNGHTEAFVGLDAEPSTQVDAIEEILARDPTIDAVHGHGLTALAAAEAARRLDRPILISSGTFVPEMFEAIERGEVQFTMDTQPYLQGYLPVVFLALTASTGVEVAPRSHVDTGMAFVDADNLDSIQELVDAGTR